MREHEDDDQVGERPGEEQGPCQGTAIATPPPRVGVPAVCQAMITAVAFMGQPTAIMATTAAQAVMPARIAISSRTGSTSKRARTGSGVALGFRPPVRC